MLGDTSDAADGTQEVFLKAFRGIRKFRQGSSLKTWLYRIAIREALNQKRWFKRHLQKNVSIDAEPEEGQARFEIADACGTPFEQLAETFLDRKSTRLNSSHLGISYAVFCLKKKKKKTKTS